MELKQHIVELIKRTSTTLPEDVHTAIKRAHREEEGRAKDVLATFLKNIELAAESASPLCQDTGFPIFWVEHPRGMSTLEVRAEIEEALKEATQNQYLRPNAVDPVSGVNTGNNVGEHFPSIYFSEGRGLKVTLLLKGGGSENVGAQYKLPDAGLRAKRDLEGVRRCVLDAVWKAQGRGCSPGVVGVGIGGDRTTSMEISKKALLRKLDEYNPDPELALLERRLHGELNQLGIGPLGLGGRTTVLGVKVEKAHRHPATYFVTVSYNCWVVRRRSMTVDGEVVTYD